MEAISIQKVRCKHNARLDEEASLSSGPMDHRIQGGESVPWICGSGGASERELRGEMTRPKRDQQDNSNPQQIPVKVVPRVMTGLKQCLPAKKVLYDRRRREISLP